MCECTLCSTLVAGIDGHPILTTLSAHSGSPKVRLNHDSPLYPPRNGRYLVAGK